MVVSNLNRCALIVAAVTSMILLLSACGSEAVEQAEVASVPPTAIPTTAPISLPTSTPIPPPTATAVPAPTSTPIPTPLPAPTAAPTTPPAAAPEPDPVPTVAPVATETAAAIETPTAIPTAIPAATAETAQADSNAAETATPVPAAPTAVVASSGETPLECFDRDVQVYRALVEGVDVLTFENGRVYCSGAGTNAGSVAGSYRHSTGLIVQRNGDFILDPANGTYIPYSGTMHFCLGGQPSTSPVRADTVPALLIVIDNEGQRLAGQGATGPVSFSSSGSQC